MRHNRWARMLSALLFLAVAGRAQTTNIPTKLDSHRPGYPMGVGQPRFPMGAAISRQIERPAAVALVSAQTSEVVLHNFASPPAGGHLYYGVVRDWAGDFYGTAGGGASGDGVVFRVDPFGNQRVLHSFTGPDGSSPNSVILDPAGNLYGTTTNGGVSGAGVVFQIDRTGHEKVLYSFTGAADGGYPNVGVIRDAAGNLYGAAGGGADGAGVVFKLDTTGHQTVLYTFTGGADGATPNDVIRDSAGNLYGTTQYGGASGAGVVFKVDSSGNETVLYAFTGGADGSSPNAGVIRDPAGNSYGTTTGGGAFGAGVVFKVDPSGQETVLYSFTGGADGGTPDAGVIRDSAGDLYGTANLGGTTGRGVVFKLDTTGHETVLYSFTGRADGAYPVAGLLADSAGDLYGTTVWGGPGNQGVVYKVDERGKETVVYGFPGTLDGQLARGTLIADWAGNLYGTTIYGGTGGWGVVFKLDADGHETVLHAFTGLADGGTPIAGAIQDWAGNLYGTAQNGGASGGGVVFKLDPSGHEKVLYNFTGGADGGSPVAGVILDPAGNLYGTTSGGGASGAGVVFKVDPAGHQTVLYTFTGGSDGSNPYGGVVRDFAGNLYGTTQGGGASWGGVVFKVDPSGNETVLHSFTWGADGGWPLSGVIRDSAGNLYGTTLWGGAWGGGVVYKLEPSGQETTLYSFPWGADGGAPVAGVMRDSAGNLYGTTNDGGTVGKGVVYKVDPTGQETVLHSFTGRPADGAYPYGGVISDSFGNLYGVTEGGGEGWGVVFKIQAAGAR